MAIPAAAVIVHLGLLFFLSGLIISSIQVDNGEWEVYPKVTALCIGNAKCFGGGMKITPNAHPSSGNFQVVVLQDFKWYDFVLKLHKLYNGTHLSVKNVSSRRYIYIFDSSFFENKQAVILIKPCQVLQETIPLAGKSPKTHVPHHSKGIEIEDAFENDVKTNGEDEAYEDELEDVL